MTTIALPSVRASRYACSVGKDRVRRQGSVGDVTALVALIRWDAAKVLDAAVPHRAYTLLIAMHRHDPIENRPLRQLVRESKRPSRAWRTGE